MNLNHSRRKGSHCRNLALVSIYIHKFFYPSEMSLFKDICSQLLKYVDPLPFENGLPTDFKKTFRTLEFSKTIKILFLFEMQDCESIG